MLLFLFYSDGFHQHLIHRISAVLDSGDTSALKVGYDRDRLTGIAAEREQKSVQFIVICVNLLNDIFLALKSGGQIHIYHPILRDLEVSIC